MKRLVHSFTARKIMELLLTLLIVTFLSFLLVKLSPVDAAEAYARRTFMLYTPEQLGELREEMGLNQPLLVQYGTWVGDALHLDFGTLTGQRTLCFRRGIPRNGRHTEHCIDSGGH